MKASFIMLQRGRKAVGGYPGKRSSDPDTDTDVPGQTGWQVSWMVPPGVETAGTVISLSSYPTDISYDSHVESGDLS